MAQHNFSAEFLRVLPPETTFSGAWESLCECLLRAEFGDSNLLRLRPPDRGVDILHRATGRAYQCKSSESGALGRIGGKRNCHSLERAWKAKYDFGWDVYCFATNAEFTGSAAAAILRRADDLGIPRNSIEFLGPEYWSELCTKHLPLVRDRFNYKIVVTEEGISSTYLRFDDEYRCIKNAGIPLTLVNNVTPVEIDIPFAASSTVKELLDVASSLLGLRRMPYFEILSIELTLGTMRQPDDAPIKDIVLHHGQRFEVRISIPEKVRREVLRRTEEQAADSTIHPDRDVSCIRRTSRPELLAWPLEGIKVEPPEEIKVDYIVGRQAMADMIERSVWAGAIAVSSMMRRTPSLKRTAEAF